MLTFFVSLVELFDEMWLSLGQPTDEGRNGW
jgi:hypothetical protein